MAETEDIYELLNQVRQKMIEYSEECRRKQIEWAKENGLKGGRSKRLPLIFS